MIVIGLNNNFDLSIALRVEYAAFIDFYITEVVARL